MASSTRDFFALTEIVKCYSNNMEDERWILREASNPDVPGIKKVVFTVLKEYGLEPDENGKDSDLDDIEQNYIRHDGYFGVIIDSLANEIVGTVGLHPENKEEIELRKMYLIKDARGFGLGKKLLETSIRISREKGYTRMTLETISPLVEAISLYKSYGFHEIAPKAVNSRVDQAFELKLKP